MDSAKRSYSFHLGGVNTKPQNPFFNTIKWVGQHLIKLIEELHLREFLKKELSGSCL